MRKLLWVDLLVALLFCSCATPTFTQDTLPAPTTASTAIPTTAATVAETLPSEPETTAATEPDPLDALLNTLTTEQKVGQLFLARCPVENAIDDIRTYHLGGYILFDRDFDNHTPESLRSILRAYQSASKIPMLIAVDEEGGDVTRVSSNPAFRKTRFPSPRKLFAQGGLPLILETEQEKCDLLKGLGINVNLSPVCDITTDPNCFMYSRSLGQDPEITASYIAAVTELMHQSNIGSVLKHFPGYGNNSDTHFESATDNRSLEQLEGCDLIPFQAGINSGCSAIMVSHTVIACLDDVLPATLSPAVHDYLRNNMGFQGVTVTDDMSMGAITRKYGIEDAAVMAVLAGNDLLCSSDYAVQYAAVLNAVNSGIIPEQTLNDAVSRILKWKQAIGLLP